MSFGNGQSPGLLSLSGDSNTGALHSWLFPLATSSCVGAPVRLTLKDDYADSASFGGMKGIPFELVSNYMKGSFEFHGFD